MVNNFAVIDNKFYNLFEREYYTGADSRGRKEVE